MAQVKEKSEFERMQSDKRTLHRRNYLVKKNGGIKRERRILELSPYQFKLNKQGGVCAICKKAPSGRSLAIDHDHSTGAVRGLLCFKCNSGISLFGEDSATLMAAVEYLKNHGK